MSDLLGEHPNYYSRNRSCEDRNESKYTANLDDLTEYFHKLNTSGPPQQQLLQLLSKIDFGSKKKVVNKSQILKMKTYMPTLFLMNDLLQHSLHNCMPDTKQKHTYQQTSTEL